MADATIWTKRVAAWRASGLTAAEYCARHGIGLSALRYWAQKSRREPGATAVQPSVRLARVERVSTTAPTTRSSVPIVIELGAARVLVERGADRATLVAVVEALRVGAGR